MIGLTVIHSQEAYAEYLTQQELRKGAAAQYYFGGEPAFDQIGVKDMKWLGKLADRFELTGKDVDIEDMITLGKGFSPKDGQALCQNAGAKGHYEPVLDHKGNPLLNDDGRPKMALVGGHRMGYEFTVSPFKAFSVLSLQIADPAERTNLIQDFNDTADELFNHVEREGLFEIRRGKGSKDFNAANELCASRHTHFASRALEANIHAHIVIYANGMDENGFGALESRYMMNNKKALDQLMNSMLCEKLKARGYKIEQIAEIDAEGNDTGRRTPHIAGIPMAMCDDQSTRQKEIDAYAAKYGVDRQTAATNSRDDKDEPPFGELMTHLQERKRLYEQNNNAIAPTIEELKQAKAVEVAQPDILERLHANDAVFSQARLIEEIGNANVGKFSAVELLAEVERFKEANGLVAIKGQRIHEDDAGKKLSKLHALDRYTSPKMLEIEQSIQHMVSNRLDDKSVELSDEAIAAGIQEMEQENGFQMSQQQHHAVRYVGKSGGTAVLEGFAGTGKTTIAKAIKKSYEAADDGWSVIGMSTANDAARKLAEETGMRCSSIADALVRLDNGKQKLSDRTVIFVDEAGMVDTVHGKRILEHANKAGAKVILMGDDHQIQAVGAGALMDLAKQAGAGSAMLTEIRRQQNELLKTAEMFYDRDAQGNLTSNRETKSRREEMEKSKALAGRLMDQGHYNQSGTTNQANKETAERYLACPDAPKDKMMIAHTNEEVQALNNLVRKGLKEEGKISTDDHTITAIQRGKKQEITLSEGDQIYFGKRNDTLGVINGTKAEVLKISDSRGGGLKIMCRVEEAGKTRRVTFDTDKFNHIGLDYCGTLHRAQGQGRNTIFWKLNAQMIDNQSTLVGFTRVKAGGVHMFGTDEDFKALERQAGRDGLKRNALEEGFAKPQNEFEARFAKAMATPFKEKLENQRKKQQEGPGLSL